MGGKRDFSKKGQIWVETVIYTLIALSMIGAVMAFVIPRVQEIQDQAVIEQSIDVMENINEMIVSTVQGGTGNRRILDISIKRGTLKINTTHDIISFEIEATYVFSEPGQIVNIGGVKVETRDIGNTNLIIMSSNYSKYNLTFGGDDETLGSATQSPTPYSMSISNKGEDEQGKINIDFKIIG